MVPLVAKITGKNLDLPVVPPLGSAIYLFACGTSFLVVTIHIVVATPIIPG